MSEFSSTHSQTPKFADPTVAAPANGSSAEESRRKSRRVRELPPPPKAPNSSDGPEIHPAEGPEGGWRRWWGQIGRRQFGSCTISCVLHCGLLIALALIVESALPDSSTMSLTAYVNVPGPRIDLGDELRILPVFEPNDTPSQEQGLQQPQYVPRVASLSNNPDRGPTEPVVSRPSGTGTRSIRPSDLLMQIGADVRGSLRGRKNRAALARDGGGNANSEQAVQWGLRWLMAHQHQNGSWNFNHNKGPCAGSCRNPGTEASTTAATAIVLLALLGAGHTPTEGEYAQVVQRGLYYLGQRTLTTPHGDDLQEGTMYGQGLATIALCEAYAMTQDRTLKNRAQEAIRFIIYAQNTKGGGWRYTPGEPGDMTVTGWQLMGLKSGQMAGLEVPLSRIYLVQRFLRSVQSEEGAQYGYMDPAPRETTTAIGLLSRMYTGWQRDYPPLQRGVAYLSQWGPSDENIYYNYYATQVMHHWEGPMWEQWNVKMRDHLIATQARDSHEAGSWYFSGGQGDKGGRLYNTAMAVMILEVYYRYMPLYRKQAVVDDF